MTKKGTDAHDLVARAIETEVFVDAKAETIANTATGTPRENGWILDFRRVIFRRDILEAVAELFWQQYTSSTPIQVGGLETAALPIVTAISLKEPADHKESVNAFFVRKSRKKDGLMRMIEGTLQENVPVVLVDDILNSGKSFIRQVEVLEELGHEIKAVWSIVRFRDESFYDYFRDKHIEVHSVFTLDDFPSVGLKNLGPRERTQIPMPFTVKWKFTSENPNHFYVVPKSDPVIDDSRVYMGSDSGIFWALNQEDGSTAWSHKVGFHAKGKSIFSSPALTENLVLFGAYDGNLYALDKETGKKEWIFWEADHIGSSPCVAEDLGLVFVGMEFGLIRKRGGIAAVDLKTGKKKWDYTMKAYTHSSPLYIAKTQQVVVGGNEGIAYLFDAKSGERVWEFDTGPATEGELDAGFSEFDIKESFAYDQKRDYIIFGNREGYLFIVDRKTGKEVSRFKAEFAFYSTPVVCGDCIYATSLDKNLYCIDLNTGEEKWRWNAGARIFASPVEIKGSIYVGANTGRLTEIDPETGKELSLVTVPERITNNVAYNAKTERFFLPTFANELYCLEKKHDA